MSKNANAPTLLDKNWKELMPEAYSWCKKVSFTHLATIEQSKAPFHAICVTEIDEKLALASSALNNSVKSEILTKYSQLFKRGSAGYVEHQGKTYVLIPGSKVETTGVQFSRQFGLDLCSFLRSMEVSSCAIHADGRVHWAAVFEGFSHGLFEAGIFTKKDEKSSPGIKIESVEVFDSRVKTGDVAKAQAMGQSVALCRFLQESPGNWLTPEKFVEIARDVAAEHSLKIKVMDRQALEKIGAGSFLSVARGSQKEAFILAIEIDGVDNSKTTALVGKGLTFDAGGISLKPSAGMGEMKYDMSGGAAVLGAAKYLGQFKPKNKTVCIVGTVENMPGVDATRPGDVVVAMNGKTIDVQNTDAEGRLVLADCLTYVIREHKPSQIIDIATLTGACLHALGHVGAGLMSNSDKFADEVLAAAKRVGEPFWRLPLWPELRKEIKGDISDLKNIAGASVMAGTIVGGLFLEEFVEKIDWAHLDIAGTGWQCGAVGFPGKLGSAFGVRTLVGICEA